jgi:hypothetical protein
MDVNDLIAKAASQGASGDYSNLSSIIKNPEAYQAFKDARLERVKETRVANTPLKPATSSGTITTPIGSGITYSSSTTTTTTPTPTPTPATPTTISSALVQAAVAPPVKTASIDTVLFDSDILPIEVMTDLIFENIGGQELINIARNDIVNGQQVSYQPIKNLSSLQQQYNPNNILSLQSTSDKYFANFSIKLENKIPEVGTGPSGANVYIDSNTGDLVVETINMEADEQVEIEISVSGTIYEAEFGETTS